MVVAPIHNPVQDSTSVCPHRFSFSGSYELPFGNGKMFLKDARGLVNQAVSGWQLNIINNLRSGFPFTPALGFNWSRDGNTSAPDRPSFAPGRTLHGIYLRRPKQWVDPTAFVLPQDGTYGNAGRNILIGPGSVTVDVSVFKTTRLTEGRNLQLRAEIFNVLNHTNFGIPSPIMLTNTGATAAAAGVITSTASTSRQITAWGKTELLVRQVAQIIDVHKRLMVLNTFSLLGADLTVTIRSGTLLLRCRICCSLPSRIR